MQETAEGVIKLTTPNVNDNPLLTLEELIAALPEELQEVAEIWGPVLFEMGVNEIKAWVNLMLLGDYATAYATLLQRKSNSELISLWAGLNAKWKAANMDNAAQIEAQRGFIMAVLKACLTIGLALLPAGL